MSVTDAGGYHQILPTRDTHTSKPDDAGFSSVSSPYSPHGWSSAYPYPYPSGTSPTGETNAFLLCFIRGSIAVCSGYHNRYTKTKQPPHDLCICHKVLQEFIPAGAGTEASHARFVNIYYHCHPQCVWLCCPEFVPTHLDTSEVLDDLSQTHKAHLNLQFGLHFS